ncbi:hypothetical protein QTP88_015478 [Uroleucon formosanum]
MPDVKLSNGDHYAILPGPAFEKSKILAETIALIDEVVCVQYLKYRGLLLADNPMTCIKVKDSVVCNSQLVEYLGSSKKRNSDGTMKKVHGDNQPLREINNSNNEDSDENEIVRTNKNYGNRIVGPRVFGICWKQPDL